MRNDAISSQRNVHPGRLLDDGTYSDARVLTPYELMILNSVVDGECLHELESYTTSGQMLVRVGGIRSFGI